MQPFNKVRTVQRRRALAMMLFVLSLVILAAPASLLSAPAVGGLKDRVLEATLPNGLKVILLENHKTPLVTFQVWYRVGSRNEEWGKTGLSHLLEHMMFKGTSKVDGEQFSRVIEERGGEYNAFTSSDSTAYFETLSGADAQIAFDLEADRMRNLVLKEEDFKTEQAVVMEERRLRTDDNPKAILSEQVEATAYQVHPYHWPVIGWMADLERLTVEDAKKYYDAYYVPSNAFIVVAGDFSAGDFLEKIKEAFEVHEKAPAPDQEKSLELAQKGERRVFVKKESQLATVARVYHVPNIRSPESYALEVIEAILSTGESSRLYRDLVRGEKLALSVDANNAALSRDPGLFSVWVEALPGTDMKDVEAALDKQMEKLCSEAVEAPELAKVKNQIEAAFVFGQDSIFRQAMLIAQYEVVSSWRAIDDYVPSIRKVTAADVQSAACRYLVPENRTAGILVPLPPKEGKPASPGPAGKERVIR